MKEEIIVDLKVVEVEEDEDIPSDADVITIIDPSKEAIDKFSKQGYFHCPVKIRYVLDTPKDREEYLESISRNKRKRILKSYRDCEKGGIKIFMEDPLTKETFDRWYDLYESTLTEKERGRILVERDWIEGKENALGVFAEKDGKLIGGSLVRKYKDINTLRIGYSAFDRDFSKFGVMDYINVEIIMAGKELNLKFIDRGKDTNRYGHHLSTGLYLFKKGFGFKVESLEKYGGMMMKINNFQKFDDKILFFSYGEKGLVGNLILKNKDENPPEFEADFLERLDVYSIENNKLDKIR